MVQHEHPWTSAGLYGVEGLLAIDGGGGWDGVEFTRGPSGYGPNLNHWDWSGVEVIRGSAGDDLLKLWDGPGAPQTVADPLAHTVIEGGHGNGDFIT